MKNIEFYKDELSGLLNPDMMYFFALDHGMKCVLKINPDIRKGNIDMKLFIEWLLEEHQILDETEKKYIKNVINPFIRRVIHVMKARHDNTEHIDIFYRDGCDIHCISFPDFKAGTMYKNMKPGKAYKTEELGL